MPRPPPGVFCPCSPRAGNQPAEMLRPRSPRAGTSHRRRCNQVGGMLEPSSQGATTGEVLCYNGATMPRFAAIVFAVSWNQRHGCWDHGHRKLEPAAVMLQPRWQHAGSGMARSWNRHPNLLRWRWGGGTGELFCWNRHAFLLLPAKFSAATSYPRASTFFESSSSACYDRRPTSPSCERRHGKLQPRTHTAACA